MLDFLPATIEVNLVVAISGAIATILFALSGSFFFLSFLTFSFPVFFPIAFAMPMTKLLLPTKLGWFGSC
jgi:hypothetical protein